MPKHLAIIMDGNGRWAESMGKNRIHGHNHGVKAVQEVVEEAVQLKIEYLISMLFQLKTGVDPKRNCFLIKLLVNTLKSGLKSY